MKNKASEYKEEVSEGIDLKYWDNIWRAKCTVRDRKENAILAAGRSE